MSSQSTGRCPVPHTAAGPEGRRKTGWGSDAGAPAVEQRGDGWTLRSYAAVRQVLRDGHGVRQAIDDALDSGAVLRSDLRQPVIFQDGAAHRDQRTAIARFFTPKTVDEAYHGIMAGLSDELVSELRERGRADLSALSMRLAVRVAAEVVGLTDSVLPGMDGRIASLLSLEHLDRPSALRRAAGSTFNKVHALLFYLLDVRPAIRARRRAPREDVISHLLGMDYSVAEILIECMTYAVAGMVTTREFIGMAAWHLLEDPDLRVAYVDADEADRHRILHEIVRLEPVAGHLHRRAATDLAIEHDGHVHHIPAGARLDLDLRAANADARAVGERPLDLCPDRPLARGVQPPVLSFGDGAHRCPGAFLAIEETDVFLHRLLRLPLRMHGTPTLGFNEKLNSYEVRDFILEVAEPGEAASGPRNT